jgi:hypothetical protein
MNEEKVSLAVRLLEEDISDRRGLKWEWNKIDPDVKQEIREAWGKLLHRVFDIEVKLP